MSTAGPLALPRGVLPAFAVPTAAIARARKADSITATVSAIGEDEDASMRSAWGITLPHPGHIRAV